MLGLLEERTVTLLKTKKIGKELDEFDDLHPSESKRSDQATRQCWLQAREPVSTMEERAKQRNSQSRN